MEKTIEVQNLCKSYGSLQAVRNVEFSVSGGEIFGLLGANGSGKSTTIECLLGTRKADTGTVSILGMNPVKDRKQLFQRVGVQFQESSCQERIKVGELCREMAALYKAPSDHLPLLAQFGLSDKLGSPVSTLSGGQKQRLFIVLAMLPNPEVLFLDELTTGLDTRARRTVWKSLSTLKAKGITILLSSHFMDEVEALCDRICILKQGEIVFMGTGSQAIETSPYHTLEEAYLWHSGDEEGEL